MKTFKFKLILLSYLVPLVSLCQKRFDVGITMGVNVSDVSKGSLTQDWTVPRAATTLRYGVTGSYQITSTWRVRVECNQETRGWDSPYVYFDSLGVSTNTVADYRYRFWTLPVILDFFGGKKKYFYASIGFAPMLQTQGTKIIRLTGEWDIRKLYSPYKSNGLYQYATLINIGYRYPIYNYFSCFVETRFNLSFNYIEPNRKAYHYAYGGIIGISYKL